MTYFLRGAILSSAAFFSVYVLLSFSVAAMWKLVSRHAETWSASYLFVLRVLPLGAAVILTFFVVLPSFICLEPYRTAETVGVTGLSLACGGLITVSFGIISVLVASWNTARFIARWPRTGSVKANGRENIVVGIPVASPVVLVAGVCQPKLLISEGATHTLKPREMQAAIRHELAHVTFHDNLRKLILRFAKFPFLSGLERCWMQAAEIVADDAAALDESAAVDLASALIKVAGHPNSDQLPELAMSLTPETGRALRIRVERLLAWQPRDHRNGAALPVGIALCVVALLTATYLPLLRHVHELSELLVR